MESWTVAQRQALQKALEGTGPLGCPACGATVAVRATPRPPGVAYVRHRVLLICTGCHRSAALDHPPPR